MAYINHQDLATLNELLDDNLTAWEGEEDSVRREHRDLIKRLNDFDKKRIAINEVASEELCDEARSLHASDEIEIDDQSVGVSHADDGSWVNAWVWVPRAEEECETCAASTETRCAPCDECGHIDADDEEDDEQEDALPMSHICADEPIDTRGLNDALAPKLGYDPDFTDVPSSYGDV